MGLWQMTSALKEGALSLLKHHLHIHLDVSNHSRVGRRMIPELDHVKEWMFPQLSLLKETQVKLTQSLSRAFRNDIIHKRSAED